jgi:hypothetical protein
MSKYLLKRAYIFFQNKVPGLCDLFTPLEWLMEMIENAAKAKGPVPKREV